MSPRSVLAFAASLASAAALLAVTSTAAAQVQDHAPVTPTPLPFDPGAPDDEAPLEASPEVSADASPDLASRPAPRPSPPSPPLAPRIERERHSVPMMVGGGVVTGAGAILVGYGVLASLRATLDVASMDRDAGARRALAPALPGLGIIAVGLPFLVVGAREVDVEPRWAGQNAPSVRISPTAADATWGF